MSNASYRLAQNSAPATQWWLEDWEPTPDAIAKVRDDVTDKITAVKDLTAWKALCYGRKIVETASLDRPPHDKVKGLEYSSSVAACIGPESGVFGNCLASSIAAARLVTDAGLRYYCKVEEDHAEGLVRLGSHLVAVDTLDSPSFTTVYEPGFDPDKLVCEAAARLDDGTANAVLLRQVGDSMNGWTELETTEGSIRQLAQDAILDMHSRQQAATEDWTFIAADEQAIKMMAGISLALRRGIEGMPPGVDYARDVLPHTPIF